MSLKCCPTNVGLSTVWLDSVLQDLHSLQEGVAAMKTRVSADEGRPVLQDFLSRNSVLLDSLIADGRTAQV